MAGHYEQQLIKIANAANWDIPELDALRSALHSLTEGMVHLSGAPGWTGSSANAASDKFIVLRDYFLKLTAEADKIQRAIDDANVVRHSASNAQARLPSTRVPDEIHAAALIGGTVLLPFIGTWAAEQAVQKYEELLRAQREAKANDALAKLHTDLIIPTKTLNDTGKPKTPEPPYPEAVPPIPIPDPGWPGPGVHFSGGANGSGAWSVGGGGGPGDGHNNNNNDNNNNNNNDDNNGDGGDDHLAVDGGTHGSTGGFGGGGLGSGLAGAGLGAGALVAGSKLAGKTPGGLFGAGNLAPGSGGLAGAGAGGGKANSAMMGGGGGAGGGEKEKRASLGLLAPKLDDDDEIGPRSASAGAGGRDQAPKE